MGFVTQTTEATEEKQLQRLLHHLKRQDLIVLDELEYVPFSKAGAELFFEVVSRAYERTSLIVTTNLPFENWVEVLGYEGMGISDGEQAGFAYERMIGGDISQAAHATLRGDVQAHCRQDTLAMVRLLESLQR